MLGGFVQERDRVERMSVESSEDDLGNLPRVFGNIEIPFVRIESKAVKVFRQMHFIQMVKGDRVL